MAIKQHLAEGMKVKILEKGKIIDEAIIQRIETGGHPPTQEIKIKSLKLHPGEKIEFAFIRHNEPNKEGWRMLFKNPMTGSRCFSQRAQIYTFEPV